MELHTIHGLLEQVAQVFCPPAFEDIKEIGILLETPPDELSIDPNKALRRVDGHFGLASWCLTPLYAEARRLLKRDSANIQAATVILIVNPDYRSAWNLRKELIREDIVRSELLFSQLVLTRAPKSAETWAHRAWLLQKYGCDGAQSERELEIAWRASSCAPNNYYAGVHRLRLLSHIPHHLLAEELIKGRKWLRTHVGDASGWWYHRALLERLEAGDETHITCDEERWLSDMQARYGNKYQNVAVFSKWRSAMAVRAEMADETPK